jgi:hypothetical protein
LSNKQGAFAEDSIALKEFGFVQSFDFCIFLITVLKIPK